MSEPARIAVIRIIRPYGSEEQFVDGDFGWLGRTTIILPNGPARPAGELVRFEIVLANGAPVFRGEGHVVAHHVPGSSRPPGLEVRFTRIDSRSKLILDRVREKRSKHSLAGPMSLAAPMTMSAATSATSIAPPTTSAAPQPPADTPSERSGVHLTGDAAKVVSPPANRDEILERLRVRARELTAAGGLAFKTK